MNTSQLLQRLGTVCPWWRDPLHWHVQDPDLGPLPAGRLKYEPKPLEHLQEGGLYVLRGPRRVGKSVELKRAILALLNSGIAPRRIIHFPCDELVAGDLNNLVGAARNIATRSEDQPRFWFLDEITATGGMWWDTIKWLRDNDRGFQQDCVVLSGSSMRGLDDAVKALAGRRGRVAHAERLLLPMGFRQFCRATARSLPPDTQQVAAWEFRDPICADAIGEIIPWLDDLILAWEAYIGIGGFPRAVNDFLHHSAVQPDFTNSLWDVIAGEALRRARDFTPAKTQRLLALVAGSLTNPVNITSLSRQLGVVPRTGRERIDDLTAAFVCWPCYPMTSRGHADHTAPSGAHPKYYFTDPLLARLACQRDQDSSRCPDASQLAEQQVGVSLLRQRESQLPGAFSQFGSVMYARMGQKEVDFTGSWMKGVAFESKYVGENWKRETRTIRNLTSKGVLLTRNILDLDSEVWAVPASVAAWLLEPAHLPTAAGGP